MKKGEHLLPQAKYLLCGQRPQEGAIKMEMKRVLVLAHEKAVENYNRCNEAYLNYPCPQLLNHLDTALEEMVELAELLHKN